MNDEIKLVKIILRPIAAIMLGVSLFSYIKKIPLYEGQYDYPKNTTGTNIQDNFTGSFNTGVTIEIPTDPRGYLEYLIENGTGGIDYFSRSPENQPDMSSKVGGDNSARMHDYLYHNRIQFELPKTDKQGYIMFITTQKLGVIKNLFVGVNGITIGWLDKKQSLDVFNDNEYLYKLNSLPLIGNNSYTFTKDLSIGPISINGVVGDMNNKLEKIIIFYK